MADDQEFESSASGASLSYPVQCSALRKNGYVLIKQRPCKIVEMSTSKTGKHGHAKVHMVGLDILTGKKYEDICPSTHNMNVPNVHREEFEVVDCSDDRYLTLMDNNGQMREDLVLPEELMTVEQLNATENAMVTVISTMGEERVIKIDSKKTKAA